MSALRLATVVLGLGTLGCGYRLLEVDERFVDVPASASCSTLHDAVATRGSWTELQIRDEGVVIPYEPPVVPHPLDETWVVSGRVEYHRLMPAHASRDSTLFEVRPRGWIVSLACETQEPVVLELRKCRVGRETFAVIDPRAIASILEERPADEWCMLVIKARLRRSSEDREVYVTFGPSLRPLLERPPR